MTVLQTALREANRYENRVFNDPTITGAVQQTVMATMAVYYALQALFVLGSIILLVIILYGLVPPEKTKPPTPTQEAESTLTHSKSMSEVD